MLAILDQEKKNLQIRQGNPRSAQGAVMRLAHFGSSASRPDNALAEFGIAR
jgi:hypothetical protein